MQGNHWATLIPSAGETVDAGRVGIGRTRRGTTPDEDYCVLTISVRTVRRVPEGPHTLVITRTRRLRQILVLSDEGRAFATRVDGTAVIARALLAVSILAEGRGVYPAPETIAQKTDLLTLSGPDAPAPARRAGVWTDGRQRVRVSFGAADGGQLYYESDQATKAVSTNVLEELQLVTGSAWFDSTSVTTS